MSTTVFTRTEARLLEAGYTEEQIIMRRGMERRAKRHVTSRDDLEPISHIIGMVMGDQGSDKDVTEEAMLLIREHGDPLVLSIRQWATVQRLVELGIISGRAGS